MKRPRSKGFRLLKKLRLNLLLILVLLVMGGIFYRVIRNTLLQNYQALGTSLAQSYALEVDGDLSVFETLLTFGAESIDARVQAGESAAEIEAWIGRYYERLQQVLGEGTVDPYAVFQGRLLAANPWDGDIDYDYTGTGWYQAALADGGDPIFTDIYTDAIYHRPVITIAQMCKDCDAVLAFDVFPENLLRNAGDDELAEGASVYVCDNQGTLLYARTELDQEGEEFAGYIARLQAGIRDGSLNRYDTPIEASDGSQRGVYHQRISTGWMVIITVPFHTILDNLNQVTLLFGLVMLVWVAALFLVTWRNLRLDQAVERTNETVRVLGNSYYALYRVNYRDDTYEMIKGSEYVRSFLPPNGPYPELLRVTGEVIEPAAFTEFQESFSSDSIRNLVSNRVRDYGGDFLRRFGEEYRWVSVRVLFDESLSPDEVVLCFREVDQEKHRQFQERKLLEDALASSRQSEKAKQSFFNNMSHDMRTPLNAILGLSDLIRQYAEEPERVRSYVEKISYSSRQLLDLVNDILDMSRMQQGKVILNNQVFDLRACVGDCVDSFRLQAEAEGKELREHYELRDAHVLGDSNRISQILNNLLSNAFKFTAGGDEVSVSVRQLDERTRAQYQIVVRDTGAGMSPEFLPHLFEPYARETRFTSQQVSGTGLGMPIVKSLVTQMSGQIYVDSKLGEGTTFTITIPFLPSREPGVQSERPGSPELIQEAFSLRGKKILLAEDNLVNMEIATEILTMNGLEIVQAWNGLEALERFQASAPFEIDAILMDMQMPQMDGCEAARRIRALSRPDARRVPILAVTANAFTEDVAATTAAGMDAHISKPIDFRVLCETLERLTR